MQFKTLLKKINPWIGIIGALCLIVPSLYEIMDNPLLLTTDHLTLMAGLLIMIIFLKQIFERIIDLDRKE